MCRIDKAYSNLTLDEKSNLAERFTQALDESGINDNFRSLLTEHFSEKWRPAFGSETYLEEALNSASKETSDQGRCAAILSSSRFAMKLNNSIYQIQCTRDTTHSSDVLVFAQEVAQTYFPDSPYSLYSALPKSDLLLTTYPWFVNTLYGEDFCFSDTLLSDPSLIVEGEPKRRQVLWQFVHTMTHPLVDGKPADTDRLLISAAELELHGGPPTYATHRLIQGIRFLEKWIAFDAAAGRLSNISEFDELNSTWEELKKRYAMPTASSDLQDLQKITGTWLEKTELNFKLVFLLNVYLTLTDNNQVERWAHELDTCFMRLSYLDIELQSSEEQKDARNKLLNLIYFQLTNHKQEAWLRWSIQKDIESALKRPKDIHLTLLKSSKWSDSEYQEAWKAIFEEELGKLNIKARLTVLSKRLCPQHARASGELQEWWDNLLKRLLQDPDFSASLTPEWAIAAADRLEPELVTPYIDKALGLLRSELSCAVQPEHHEQLEILLSKLSFFNPSKALRHRLMLMRSLNTPFSDDSLSCLIQGANKNVISWYSPLQEMAKDRLAHCYRTSNAFSREEQKQVELGCYESFTLELVDFCLSRLRLRKGEKLKNDKYETDQITEKSPIWRQGYLKVLLELGLDPRGKTHKAVYFTKESDPDESVRSIAKECCRVVRREGKKSRSLLDFKRGLIAAEWWLLLSQRLELKLDTNYENALKIRRSLLRKQL